MTKINFVDLPDTSTPLNATNMNALQTNVENAITAVIVNMEKINSNKFSLETGVTLAENQSFVIGNMVFINLKLNADIDTSYTTYLTIDTSLKPLVETAIMTSTSKTVPSNGWIRSNGEIAIKFDDSGSAEDIRILSFYPLF